VRRRERETQGRAGAMWTASSAPCALPPPLRAPRLLQASIPYSEALTRHVRGQDGRTAGLRARAARRRQEGGAGTAPAGAPGAGGVGAAAAWHSHAPPAPCRSSASSGTWLRLWRTSCAGAAGARPAWAPRGASQQQRRPVARDPSARLERVHAGAAGRVRANAAELEGVTTVLRRDVAASRATAASPSSTRGAASRRCSEAHCAGRDGPRPGAASQASDFCSRT